MGTPIVSLCGFLLTRDDWETLNPEERLAFSRMLEDDDDDEWPAPADGPVALL